MDYVEEFLRSVLPSSGRYCVVGMKGGGPRKRLEHHFTTDIREVGRKALELSDTHKEAYFALATFGERNQRTADNAVSMHSFFFDLDCGEGKPYPDAGDAEAAILAFCEQVGLPSPTLVSSGYGLHAYWPLTEDVPAAIWQPMASRLKALAREHGLQFDPVVPDDLSRVLRVPGTCNYKREPERPVEIRVLSDPVTLEVFEGLLGKVEVEVIPLGSETAVSEVSKALLNNRTSNFAIIARKSISGTGCNALRHILLNQETIDEPLWYSGLSIAQHCEDGDAAIHKMSHRHPEYDYDTTVRKAAGAKYPHNCDKFRDLVPELCAGCPLGVKNPIVLGHVIVAADPVEPDEEEILYERELTLEDAENIIAQSPTVSFNPPFPYFRGKTGGIYRKDKDDDGEPTDKMIYEHDLFATQRLHDPNDGEVVVFKLRLPQDVEREFAIPLADLHAPNQFRAIVGRNGVAGSQQQMRGIMDYAIKYAKDLQLKGRAREARLQFGWTEKRDGFVVGNRLYKATKVLHNPASSTTADMLPWFESRGALSEWKAIVNSLAAPGLEPLQLGLLCGFGSPLMPFTGFSGTIINLMSNESGTGKTTSMQLGLSVFGHPVRTMFLESDTINSVEHKLGVFNNMMAGFDELTNASEIYISNMVYGVSNGRGKDRMESHKNQLRANTTRWQLLAMSSSNSSLVSKLAKMKARADGEMMRLIEVPVDRVIIPYGDQIFARLADNYGVAGPIFAQWLVKNMSAIPQLIDRQRDRFWKRVGKRIEERFIIAAFSAGMVGFRASQKLGLHDLSLQIMEDWLVNCIVRMRDNMVAEIGSGDSLIGEFLNANASAIIGVNKTVLNAMTGSHVFYQPRGNKIVARFEIDETGSYMYIAKNIFRDYCVDRQYTMAAVLEEATKPHGPYQYVGVKKKRLLSDSGVLVPAVDTLVFVCSEEEMDHMVAAMEQSVDPVES